MNIRPAVESDIAAMMEIAKASPTAAHWTRAAYERIFLREPDGLNYIALVAEDSTKRVIGFIVAREIEGHDDWEIENIVVDAAEQRRGCGSALVAASIKRALDAHGSRLRLEVRASNVAAIALYRKFDFQEVNRRKQYYVDPPEDAVILELDLLGALLTDAARL